ncbi:MAG: O-antigen ligase family protein [Candidatus Zambryskibacteria bacterium]|nr:O-antigen ligase family protein [Candidatus Zambryskibacteria bacterium]
MNKQILKYVIVTGLFLVPFISFLISSAFFFPFITTKAFAWRIIVEIVFAAWLILALLDTDYRPKKSLILYAMFGFLAIVGLADILGMDPIKSFWSNFERMDGFITLLHLGMFFIVISSVFKEVDWKRWWNVSLVASFIMVLYSVLQIIGLKTINQGGVRVDGTLGNAIYLAVYMLFHIFIAFLFMWREWKNIALRWVYGLLILTQAFVLYYTATRGAILGLLGGLLVIAVLNVRNKENKIVRKAGISGLVGLVVLIGGFVLIRNSEFVISSPVLSRFSSLAIENLNRQGRYYVWPMALEGVKDRLFLGWGQENFSYVFQEYYSPEMYSLEPWFDRAHNIFLDWAVAGGLLGLVAYLSLYLTLIYLIWKPVRRPDGGKDKNFSHTEKSILTGLVAAYFFHNFFVFDHLISYILFFSLLSYIHSRSWQKGNLPVPVQEAGSRPTAPRFAPGNILAVALPAVSILLVLSLYFANVKPIMANVFLIEALKSLQTPGKMAAATQYFQKAHNTSRLGRPEVLEHMLSNAINILQSDISMEEKNAFFSFVKDAALTQNEGLKEDARYQLITGSFLSSTGFLDEALVSLERARTLMPDKQQIYFEIGAAYINKKEPLKALEVFKEAYELAPEYTEAKLIYLIGAIYANDKAIETDILNRLTEREVVFDDRIINAYYANKRINQVVNLLEKRIKLDPDNTDKYKELIKQASG